MYFIGDIIKINVDIIDRAMLVGGDKAWESYITRKIVAIPYKGLFLVSHLDGGHEELVGIEDIIEKV